MNQPPQTPAGWYTDPKNPQAQRYWDGSRWTSHTSPPAGAPAPAVPPAQPAVALPAVTLDPYSQGFNVAALPEQQREAYKQHQLTEFPTWAFVVLSIVTIGIFGTIYHGLKHSKLPLIKSDDFTAGKGIGFLFIPFFNLYWVFVFWLRLADRINFQYRLRGAPDPVSRNLVLWTIISVLAANILIFPILVSPILALISGAQIQSAANALSRGEVEALPALGAPGTQWAAAPATPPPPPPPGR